jgi:hypothetical protein
MKFKAITLGILLALPAPSLAFQCPGGIVQRGDSEYSVIRKCGKPRHKAIVGRDKDGSPVIEKWYYKWDHRSFEYILTIREGTVSRIQTGQK